MLIQTLNSDYNWRRERTCVVKFPCERKRQIGNARLKRRGVLSNGRHERGEGEMGTDGGPMKR